MTITSAGTAVALPPGLGASGTGSWENFRGSIDVTMIPLNQMTTGDVMAHVTF